jgi:hypothetical protein
MIERTKKSGLALRPGVLSPSEILKFVKVIDQSGVTNVFVPDIAAGFDSIELCCASLGVSKGLTIGTGVIRLLEHDSSQLIRRLKTLQSISENRFVLGLGAGRPGNDPSKTIDTMLERLQSLKHGFSKGSDSDIAFPETMVAALRSGIAKKMAEHVDGFLLNFCSARYAASIVKSVKAKNEGDREYACYLKVFFSKSDEIGKKLLIEEFAKYDSMPWYHKMFELDGVSQDIRSAVGSLRSARDDIHVPESLLEISPVNPTSDELAEYVSNYRNAGISLPCVYPYFSAEEDNFEYKLKTVERVISTIATN